MFDGFSKVMVLQLSFFWLIGGFIGAGDGKCDKERGSFLPVTSVKGVELEKSCDSSSMRPYVTPQSSLCSGILNCKKQMYTNQEAVNPQKSDVHAQQDRNCDIKSDEVLRAMKRAKTEECRNKLATVACLNKEGKLYPKSLPRFCPLKGKHPLGMYLGCFKDREQDRDLNRYRSEFPDTNTPHMCIDYCLNGGYMYAGVQNKTNCWCGDIYGKHGLLPEPSCANPCPGNSSFTCGGVNAQKIFSTGLPAPYFERKYVNGRNEVRIVFVLTVNGKAVRQVKRLIKNIYHRRHYFYIHVDSRSEYMYRELLKLENVLPNVHLARKRFATLWGSTSLLQAHLAIMKALLEKTDWKWDYYVNLSESDYPIKKIESLSKYLTTYKGYNFLLSSGRETPRFIEKQGLGHTFYECDYHLWKLGKRQLPRGIQFGGGSDWIGLYRGFCQYSVSNTDLLITGLKELYRFTFCPVESFFHTLLINSVYCDKWMDANLHVTNWKRNQGCKCQNLHVVDWCGCSPNVLKPGDLEWLKSYSTKPKFFVRKVEPIINQGILNEIDVMRGKDIKGVPRYNCYWQNDFHYMDQRSRYTDITVTLAKSLIRKAVAKLGRTVEIRNFYNITVLETTVLYVKDKFYRFLIKYNLTMHKQGDTVTFESSFKRSQRTMILHPGEPIERLKSIEVGTDWDVKEEIFRNFPKILGPHSRVVLRHAWFDGPPINVSIAWVDPVGRLAKYSDISVKQAFTIPTENPKLTTPLLPGRWTVYILHVSKVVASLEFLVLPYTTYNGTNLTFNDVLKYHNGPNVLYSIQENSTFESVHKIPNPVQLLEVAQRYGRKTGSALEKWVDKLSSTQWTVDDTCFLGLDNVFCSKLERCSKSKWSSVSFDPKSDISTDILKQ